LPHLLLQICCEFCRTFATSIAKILPYHLLQIYHEYC
jgi:hypothetical protein